MDLFQDRPAAVSDDVKKELDRSGLSERMDREAYFAAIEDVINAYDQRAR